MVRAMELDTCPTELSLEWFVSQTQGDAFSSDSAGGDDVTHIETHLSTCDTCRERVRSLRHDASLLLECRHVLDVARSATIEPRAGSDSLGHFTLLEELGAGGQGVVWKALDRRTGRHVALKVLRLGQFAPARQRQRLEREIEIVASLRHPGIVTLFESLDLPSGGKAIVMELIDGKPFDLWCAELRASTDAASARRSILTALIGICDAIHHAHLRGVIHRDLKPSNILFDPDGRPHIVDFGIAKAANASGEAHAAITTEPIGSPAYMAPEQGIPAEGASDDRVDLRADVYSLGAIAFEALTGRRAFSERRSVADLSRAADGSELVPRVSAALRASGEHVSRAADLDAVLMTALASEPDRRYASAREFALDLAALRDGAPVAARRESLGYHLRWMLRRHRRLVVGAAVALAIAVTAIGAYLVTTWRHEARQRELVAWGTSLSSLLADADLDFPEGSIGKSAAIRLDESSVADAATRLDALLAQGQLTKAEETTLSLALARICYLAGSSLVRPVE
jgi:eukaryotic-like serine/threonine-protein kinase